MYWVKGDRDVPAVYQNRHLRKAITAVLQQLYDRKYVFTYYTRLRSLIVKVVNFVVPPPPLAALGMYIVTTTTGRPTRSPSTLPSSRWT